MICLGVLSVGLAQQASTQQPITISPWVLHAKIKHVVIPEYPQDASEHKIQGDITINVLVDSEGNVVNATWINDGSSPLLSQPALGAIRQWKYEPTLANGESVAVASWVVIRFQVTDKPTVEILTREESTTPVNRPEKLIFYPTPRKLRLSSGAADKHKISGEDPLYPQMAKIAHVQGDVVLKAIIDKEGNIQTLTTVSGHPLLVQPAMDAVKTWKYNPWILSGEPVEVETTITVRFHM